MYKIKISHNVLMLGECFMADLMGIVYLVELGTGMIDHMSVQQIAN